MSALDLHALRLDFRKRLQGLVEYPGDDRVHWENQTFEPPSDEEPWLKENLVPGDERVVSTGFVNAQGLYFLNVYTPVGKGTEKADLLAQAIVTAFEGGQSFDGYHINRCERQAPKVEAVSQSADSVWYVIPVVVYWRAFARRRR